MRRDEQQFRLVLGWILTCAVEEGWMESNPALATRKFSHERKRARLTIEDYRKIWGKAPAWVQVAMDLSLLTLLRREDVVSLRFSDARAGSLWVVAVENRGQQRRAPADLLKPLLFHTRGCEPLLHPLSAAAAREDHACRRTLPARLMPLWRRLSTAARTRES